MVSKLLDLKSLSGPLYGNLENIIHDQIEQGELKPGDRLESTDVLAKKWNVSPATVLHSLQRLAAKGVVVRKPRSGTYVNPEMNGSTTSATIAKNVVMISPDNRFPEAAPIMQGIQEVAHENELDVVVGNTNGTEERLREVFLRQIDSNPFGIYLTVPLTGTLDPEVMQKIIQSRIPVVSSGKIPGTSWPSVGGNTAQDLGLIVRHLCQQGRKRIAFLSYTINPDDMKDCFKIFHYAFIDALCKAGGTYYNDLQLSVPVVRSFDEILQNKLNWGERISQWLLEHDDIDAICCSYDRIAWSVIKALRQIGRKVPDDVAVAGIGNLAPHYGFEMNELTTVDTNGHKTGAQVCKLLIAMRNGEESASDLRIDIPGRLIVGESTILSQ